MKSVDVSCHFTERIAFLQFVSFWQGDNHEAFRATICEDA